MERGCGERERERRGRGVKVKRGQSDAFAALSRRTMPTLG